MMVCLAAYFTDIAWVDRFFVAVGAIVVVVMCVVILGIESDVYIKDQRNAVCMWIGGNVACQTTW